MKSPAIALASAVPLVLVLVGSVAAAPRTFRLQVGSDPEGATVEVDGVVRGVTPLDIRVAMLAKAKKVKLRLTLPGYVPYELGLKPVGKRVSVAVPLARVAGRVIVNTSRDVPPAYDGLITLREALLYARGDRAPKGADRTYVQGRVGKGRADRIEFHPKTFMGRSYAFVTTELPPLDDPGDVLAGPNASDGRVTVMPAGGRGLLVGLLLKPKVRVERLTIDGFATGVRASGYGQVELRSVEVRASHVGIEARDGVVVRCPGGVTLDARFAPRLADAGCLITGAARAVSSPLGRGTLIPTRAGRLVVEGSLRHGRWAPRLYLRQAKPVKISAIKGIKGRSSSMEAYRVFGGVGDQKWQRYAIDGHKGSFFQWEAHGKTAKGSWLTFTFPRVVRGQAFALLQGSNAAHALLRYRFQLLDHARRVRFHTDVTARGPGKQDLIRAPKPIDFSVLRIEVLEAKGKMPAIHEIITDLQDSQEVLPLGHTARQAVFDKAAVPPKGAVLRLGSRIYGVPAGADAVRLVEAANGRWTRPSRAVFRVSTLEDGERADDQLTLRELLLFLLDRRKLSVGEKRHAVPGWESRDKHTARIELPAGTLKLTKALPSLGGGKRWPRIEVAGHRTKRTKIPWKSSFFAHQQSQIVLSDLDLTGPMTILQTGLVELRRVTIRHTGKGKSSVDARRILIQGCTIASPNGIDCLTGEVLVVDSRFDNSIHSLSYDTGRPFVCLNTTFAGKAPWLECRQALNRGTRAWLILAGNRAPRAARPKPGRYGGYPMIAAGNDPPALRFPRGWIGGDPKHDGGRRLSQVHDLRTGVGPVAVRFVDSGFSGEPWLLRSATYEVLGRGPAVVLYDKPHEIWWQRAGTTWRVALTPPRFRGDPQPALATTFTRPRTGLDETGGLVSSRDRWVGQGSLETTRDLAPRRSRAPTAPKLVITGLSKQIDAAIKTSPTRALDLAVSSYERWPVEAFAIRMVVSARAVGQGLVKAGRAKEAQALYSKLSERFPECEDLRRLVAAATLERIARLVKANKFAEATKLLDAAGDSKARRARLRQVLAAWARSRLASEEPKAVLGWMRGVLRARAKTIGKPLRDDFVRALSGQSLKDIGTKKWPRAHAGVDALLALAPANKVGRQNMVYVIQEWSEVRLATEDPAAVAAWIDAEGKRLPALTTALKKTARSVLIGAANAARKRRDHARAYAIQGVFYARDPSGNNRKYLLSELMTWCEYELKRRKVKQALAAITHAKAKHGKLKDFAAYAATPFSRAVDRATKRRSWGEAVQLARGLHRALGVLVSERLLARALAGAAAAKAAAKDGAGELKLWANALKEFPASKHLRAQGGRYYNNRAVKGFNRKDYASAIELLRRGLQLSPKAQHLIKNLKAAYYNRVVQLLDARKRAEAKSVLAEGRKRFPKDKPLARLQPHVDR